MSRSSAPLALSVVSVTDPGDVEATAFKIMEFDKGGFGIRHDYTWDVLPACLQGVLDPLAVQRSLFARPKRISNCVTALCYLGKQRPVGAKSFADFPEARLKTISMIQWGPDVLVRAKASCWYVDDNGQAVIPLLQPRKAVLSREKLAVYLALGRQAHCKGDWASARTELIDLSGDDRDGVHAVVTAEADLPKVSDDLLGDYVRTYIEAKKIADLVKAPREKKPKDRGMGDMFAPES
ncbi:hypothetical protein ABVV53_05500 [Novosphingobium sp. RD2P27]|uniref:Uncharacterized protein n=1 Tax=Novosphingobium kalidii TaxID=3230299 RepID=A0ABV2CZ98_9SPHN